MNDEVGTRTHREMHNDANDAIEAIEAELRRTRRVPMTQWPPALHRSMFPRCWSRPTTSPTSPARKRHAKTLASVTPPPATWEPVQARSRRGMMHGSSDARTPTAHTHPQTEVTGLAASLAAKAPRTALWLPGTSGNYVSAPYVAALGITGNLDVRWCGLARQPHPGDAHVASSDVS